MVVTEEGIVIVFNAVQPSNAELFIVVREDGSSIRSTLIRPLHPLKADAPIVITDEGIVKDVNPVQF